jgi:predicted RNA-binding protein with RPS1 domain
VLGAVYRGKVSGIMEFGCFVEVQGFGHLGKKVGTSYTLLRYICRS